jgi:hypothetical protein
VKTSTEPRGILGSVASLLAATLYQGNPDMNQKLWNIVSTENATRKRRNVFDSPCTSIAHPFRK